MVISPQNMFAQTETTPLSNSNPLPNTTIGGGHINAAATRAPNVSGYNERAMTEKILQKLKLENYELGKSKVFLRAGQIGILDSERAGVLDSAAKRI
ncbi:hypothetical protein Tco_0731285 [Tanacetum coccineum]